MHAACFHKQGRLFHLWPAACQYQLDLPNCMSFAHCTLVHACMPLSIVSKHTAFFATIIHTVCSGTHCNVVVCDTKRCVPASGLRQWVGTHDLCMFGLGADR